MSECGGWAHRRSTTEFTLLDPDVVGDGDPYPLEVIEARGPSAMRQGPRGRLRTGSPVAKRILDPNLGCVVMLRGALKVVIW